MLLTSIVPTTTHGVISCFSVHVILFFFFFSFYIYMYKLGLFSVL